MDLSHFYERDLQACAEVLLATIGIRVVRELLRCGKGKGFVLDALGIDDHNHSIVVVELKTKMDKGALGQLALYCQVVSKTLREMGCSIPVRGLLISTFVDLNLVEMAAQGVGPWPIQVKACVFDGNGTPMLIDAANAPESQCWDQCGTLASRHRLQLALQEASALLSGS